MSIVEEVSIAALIEESVGHIKEALHKAIHNPAGEPLGKEILEAESLRKYYDSWGREDDFGCAAVLRGEVIGVCWCRLFKDGGGYGYIDDETPELSIAMWEPYRGQGIGTRLMAATIEEARRRGFGGLSLSVQTENRSISLYRRMGFREVIIKDEDFTMYLDLGSTVS